MKMYKSWNCVLESWFGHSLLKCVSLSRFSENKNTKHVRVSPSSAHDACAAANSECTYVYDSHKSPSGHCSPKTTHMFNRLYTFEASTVRTDTHSGRKTKKVTKNKSVWIESRKPAMANNGQRQRIHTTEAIVRRGTMNEYNTWIEYVTNWRARNCNRLNNEIPVNRSTPYIR